MADQITCGHCHGTGLHALDRGHAETLREIRRARGEVSAVDLVARLPGVNGTAMCNRLVMLERAGLVTRVGRRGRRVYFRAVRKPNLEG